jgi:hypothetical protein
VTDDGYEIEIRVPFKTLKYQGSEAQDWRINVVRRVVSTGIEYSWVAARRAHQHSSASRGPCRG